MRNINKNYYKRIALVLLIISSLAYALNTTRMPESYLLTDPEIDEASGLAASRLNPGMLYTHNDSGGKNVVYVINSIAQSKGRIVLEGIRNRDWEDIAVGPGPETGTSYIYVGEIGDNRAQHSSVFIYRFKESILPADSSFTIIASDVQKLEIVYEDGPRDAEALFIDPRNADIYIISKREEEVGLYKVSTQNTDSLNIAKRLLSIPFSMVTAADISIDGRQILLKTYTGIWRFKVGKNQSIADALKGRAKDMKYVLEPQGEAVAFDARGKGYYTLSERHPERPLYLNYYKK